MPPIPGEVIENLPDLNGPTISLTPGVYNTAAVVRKGVTKGSLVLSTKIVLVQAAPSYTETTYKSEAVCPAPVPFSIQVKYSGITVPLIVTVPVPEEFTLAI
jgi:hypothetical protein